MEKVGRPNYLFKMFAYMLQYNDLTNSACQKMAIKTSG